MLGSLPSNQSLELDGQNQKKIKSIKFEEDHPYITPLLSIPEA